MIYIYITVMIGLLIFVILQSKRAVKRNDYVQAIHDQISTTEHPWLIAHLYFKLHNAYALRYSYTSDSHDHAICEFYLFMYHKSRQLALDGKD